MSEFGLRNQCERASFFVQTYKIKSTLEKVDFFDFESGHIQTDIINEKMQPRHSF